MSIDVRNSEFFKLLEEIKVEIRQKFDRTFVNKMPLKVQQKADNSIVTDIDIFISDIIKSKFLKKYDFLNFYSEEDQVKLEFPVLILDPIDGTKELAKGVNECAVSFGIYFSAKLDDPRNFSWIYNPFNEFEISSIADPLKIKRLVGDKFMSYVSRTEYEAQLHLDCENIKYYPKGSIAFKLGILAAGAGDFVISKKPKNIWDIMAGTHICFNRGIYLYQNGKKIESISENLIDKNLVWASVEVWEKVKTKF